MTSESVTLNCPKCGSSDQALGRELAFGVEYKCKHCGTTSVVIINNRLYLPLPGERICGFCGRVSDKESRYCQCGRPLVRKCINKNCLKEFPVDHKICDFCGQIQSDNKNSLIDSRTSFRSALEQIENSRDRFVFALKFLNNGNFSVKDSSQMYTNNCIVLCRDKRELEFYLDQLRSLDLLPNPHYVDVLITKTIDQLRKLNSQ